MTVILNQWLIKIWIAQEYYRTWAIQKDKTDPAFLRDKLWECLSQKHQQNHTKLCETLKRKKNTQQINT